MIPPRTVLTLALAAAAALTAGCPSSEIGTLQGKIISLQQQNEKLTEEKRSLKDLIEEQQRQIDTLRSLGGEKRLEKLYVVQAIQFGRFSGGIDTDGKEGDDGVKAYLEPVDQTGSILKAAGSVKLQLYDLSAPPKENLIKECRWGVDEVAKQWYGGFGVYHYSFECLWDHPPKHDEITVRAEFTDYLTGKSFSAQLVCKVHLPTPPTQPTSGPATRTTTQGGAQPATQR